jgi:hypothetical protein
MLTYEDEITKLTEDFTRFTCDQDNLQFPMEVDNQENKVTIPYVFYKAMGYQTSCDLISWGKNYRDNEQFWHFYSEFEWYNKSVYRIQTPVSEIYKADLGVFLNFIDNEKEPINLMGRRDYRFNNNFVNIMRKSTSYIDDNLVLHIGYGSSYGCGYDKLTKYLLVNYPEFEPVIGQLGGLTYDNYSQEMEEFQKLVFKKEQAKYLQNVLNSYNGCYDYVLK